MTIEAQEDNARLFWPDSPSKYGQKTGVHTKNGKTNGSKSPSSKNDATTNAAFLEVHRTDVCSSSDAIMTVNSHLDHHIHNTKTRVLLSNDNSNTSNDNNTGPMHRNTLTPEFITSKMSSFAKITSTISDKSIQRARGDKPDDLCIDYYFYRHDSTMSERNNP